MTMNATTKLVGAAVLSLLSTFNAQAEPQFAHPLLDYTTGATAYMFNLSREVSNVIGNSGTVLARGAASDLEAALVQPAERPRMIYFPKETATFEQRLVAVVPPASLYNAASIPVCVEQNGQLLGKWSIELDGRVVANNTPISVTEGMSPCQAFTLAEGKAWMQQK